MIGLIVAGVVGGQTLVEQAKLRKITTEATQYEIAINTFKLEYNNALPGDFNNAYAYWGNNCAGNANDCNGNGNKFVDYFSGGPNGVESLRAWQHLQLAGLINNSLTGVGVQCDGRSTLAGINIPKGPIGSGTASSGWQFLSSNGLSGEAGLVIGNKEAANCWNHSLAFITPSEAYSVDLKSDDGDPMQGKIISWLNHGNVDCMNGSNEYNVAIQDVECSLAFDLF